MSRQDLFQNAVAAFQRGDLATAQRYTTALLTVEPNHADGLQLVALIARQ